MSSLVAKMLFTGVTIAIVAIAAFFMTSQNQANEPHGAPNAHGRRRRSSTPQPNRNNGWYDPPDEDDDIIESIESAHPASPASVTIIDRSTDTKDTCSICMEKYEKIKRNGIEIHSTMCGHIFCQKCIRRAIGSYPFCPQCRKPCRPGSTHVIYI